MKKIILTSFICLYGLSVFCQQVISGRLVSFIDKRPLIGATIQLISSDANTTTDRLGQFTLTVQNISDSIRISFVGFQTINTVAKSLLANRSPIEMMVSSNQLAEVIISTGYQTLPRERATGSFSHINNTTFNQQVSTDILSRLEGVTNSVIVDRTTGGSGNRIMVRGLSTITGPKDPLIILDNFPYDGDINNINPNDVDNISVLKDAAAASIWGARAGNGVIVITTKKGKINQPLTVDFNANVSFAGKPDLSYIQQMSSSDFIDVEQYLFKQGFYDGASNDPTQPVQSPVVTLLIKKASGLISEAEANTQINNLRHQDIRDDYNKYFYKPSVNQQYAINLRGGNTTSAWTASSGYDHDISNLNALFDRLNLRFSDQYRPTKNLSLAASIYYTQSRSVTGRPGYGAITSKNDLYFFPYGKLADVNGNPVAFPKDYSEVYLQTAGNGKLLDWKYYPLEDYKHASAKNTLNDVLMTGNANYKILPGLNADFKYQYERQSSQNRNWNDQYSYFSRDVVNRFTQVDASGNIKRVIAQGGVLDLGQATMSSNGLRGQLNYNHGWGLNELVVIGGGEIRRSSINSDKSRFYGYNPDLSTFVNVDYTAQYPTLVNGNSAFIPNNSSIDLQNTRYISAFANAAYTFGQRYTVSLSGRRDASNLFGVKTNDQWNPFWSVGTSWDVSSEKFYKSHILPYLKFRITYGSSGNIDPGMVAATTITYYSSLSPYTRSPYARFKNYHNPELRWETSKLLNLGIDFKTVNDRITGTIEYYQKKGSNLFGTAILDYTGGVGSQIIKNAAAMNGNGIDLELNSININSSFKWLTTFNFSFYKDKITDYHLSNVQGSNFITDNQNVTISGLVGKPVYSVFGYKWGGLNPVNGDPQGYLNGQSSTDYNLLTGVGTQVSDLRYFGSALPTKFGSLINTFSFKNVTLSFSLVFKLGYYFRRNSINYTNLFEYWQGDPDYSKRWQKPGDESHTQVPSLNYPENYARDAFYTGSELHISKADHIRLQFINLSYDITRQLWPGSPFKSFQVYVNASNLGLMWRANNYNIDPDYYNSAYALQPSKTYAFGIRTNF